MLLLPLDCLEISLSPSQAASLTGLRVAGGLRKTHPDSPQEILPPMSLETTPHFSSALTLLLRYFLSAPTSAALKWTSAKVSAS